MTHAVTQHLRILGLHSTANLNAEKLRAAFLKAAMQWHPDRQSSSDEARIAAEEKFKQIHSSYQFLQSSYAWWLIEPACTLPQLSHVLEIQMRQELLRRRNSSRSQLLPVYATELCLMTHWASQFAPWAQLSHFLPRLSHLEVQTVIALTV